MVSSEGARPKLDDKNVRYGAKSSEDSYALGHRKSIQHSVDKRVSYWLRIIS